MNNRDGFPGDKRKERRTLLFTPIEFVADKEVDEILNGVIVNLSDSGMNIFSYVPLSEGQKITIIRPLHIPHQEFIVQWIHKYLDDFFMLGLKNMRCRPDGRDFRKEKEEGNGTAGIIYNNCRG